MRCSAGALGGATLESARRNLGAGLPETTGAIHLSYVVTGRAELALALGHAVGS